MLSANEDLARKLAALEKKYDSQFKVVFEAIRELMSPPEQPRREIGFHPGVKKASWQKRADPEVRAPRHWRFPHF